MRFSQSTILMMIIIVIVKIIIIIIVIIVMIDISIILIILISILLSLGFSGPPCSGPRVKSLYVLCPYLASFSKMLI